MKKKSAEYNVTFETTLEELGQIIARLESGELPLEQALHEFEQGVQLARQGQKMLQQAEQRVQILLNDSPEAQLTNFRPRDDNI